jgi:predicted ATPase
MITSLSLTNFKCYAEKTTFPLSNINLLTGINGKGKSSVLQALLLMKQSIERNPYTTQLFLSGDWVDLHSFQEMKNKYINETEVVIELLLDEKNRSIYIVSENSEKNGKADIQRRELIENSKAIDYSISPLSKNLSLFKNIHYVSAGRLNAENSYKEKELKPTGGLALKELTHNQELTLEVNRTLQAVFEEEIQIKVLDLNDPIVVRFVIDGTEFLPSTVGFGYSYMLPIIISGLIAKENEILIIENPEAHLHPKAQSRLMKFLAKVAKKGVQIFIESHSDHILNALRICVKKEILEAKEVNVFFFANDKNSKSPKIFMPQIDKNGGISDWQEGFFDEWENSLMELV